VHLEYQISSIGNGLYVEVKVFDPGNLNLIRSAEFFGTEITTKTEYSVFNDIVRFALSFGTCVGIGDSLRRSQLCET
jgi:hypothetical protein